ncbi:MAG: hypothetical protein LBM98_05690 [Oscillospiraceae bacterium]|jgi:hypothetical protein|nr:hypothetical protein [Oscillospiraceae bacterium]
MAMIESNLFAILTAVAAFIFSWAVFKTKLSHLEGIVKANEARLERAERDITTNASKILARDEEMKSVHRELAQINGLDLSAKLARIEAEIEGIRLLLEQIKSSRGV